MNRKQKTLVKMYIGCLLLIGLIVNWEEISWVFNFDALSGVTYEMFNSNNSPVVLSDNNVGEVKKTPLATPVTGVYTDQPDSIEIPSIGLVSGVVVGRSTDNAVLTQDLDRGVVYYPGSTPPGENGQTIMLGHSAPPNWPKIKHDWVFSKIGELNPGDLIHVNFEGRKYTYRMKEKKIIKAGAEIGYPIRGSTLILISCWPPGKNYQRIAVEAELVL